MLVNSHQDEEWGQFVIIHPEMYEYKQQVKSCYNKFIVNQKIGHDYLNEMGKLETIPEYTQSQQINTTHMFNDNVTYKFILITNASRFVILCIVHMFNYMLNFVKRR